MRYLVSGAWGYGNIGDDAILEATIPLIKKFDADAEITCVTYDIKYTREAKLDLPEPLLPSMHRVLSGTEGFWFMTEKDHAVSCYGWPYFFERVFQKYVKRFLQTQSIKKDKKLTDGGYERLVEEFKKADVFIMSGGGYFNTWQEQFNARIRELELAHQYDCKVMLFGQSIGPFTEVQKQVLKKTLLHADAICVRDPESVAELRSLGFDSGLSPDLAMGRSRVVEIKKGLLTICPAELRKNQELILANQIAKLVKKYGYSVRLTITRWIDPDVATLNRLKKLLGRYGVESVEVLFPKTYPDVLSSLEGSEWVVSRGLHAMILGWRTGSRVFALTKSRKVDGFLLAVNQPENQCSEKDWIDMASTFAKCASKPYVYDQEEHAQVAKRIEDEFFATIKKAVVVQ